MGDRKTALFLIMSDTDATFNFVIAMLHTPAFQPALRQGGRCAITGGCRFMCGALLDEFANIGQIPNFEKLIATIRSREISACLLFCRRRAS